MINKSFIKATNQLKTIKVITLKGFYDLCKLSKKNLINIFQKVF